MDRCYFIFIVHKAGIISDVKDNVYMVVVTESCSDEILETYPCQGLSTVSILLESFLHPVQMYGDKYNNLPFKNNLITLYRGEICKV